MLAKVINLQGITILPWEEKKEPTVWEEFSEDIIKLSQSIPFEQVVEELEKKYELTKK